VAGERVTGVVGVTSGNAGLTENAATETTRPAPAAGKVGLRLSVAGEATVSPGVTVIAGKVGLRATVLGLTSRGGRMLSGKAGLSASTVGSVATVTPPGCIVETGRVGWTLSSPLAAFVIVTVVGGGAPTVYVIVSLAELTPLSTR